MKQFIIEIDDVDMMVLEYILLDVGEWIQDAINGKIAKCYKKALTAESLLNPEKLSPEEMKAEVEKLKLPKRKDKEAELFKTEPKAK